jgi:hypothetical protein
MKSNEKQRERMIFIYLVIKHPKDIPIMRNHEDWLAPITGAATLSVHLGISDRQHLYKLRSFLGSDAPSLSRRLSLVEPQGEGVRPLITKRRKVLKNQ